MLCVFAAFMTSCSECEHDVMSGNDAYITSCQAVGAFGSIHGVIDNNTIVITVPVGTDVNALDVTMEVTSGAYLDRDPQGVTDWSSPVEFEVTSATGGAITNYIVSIVVSQDEELFAGVIRIGTQTELDAFGKLGYTKVGGFQLYSASDDDVITTLAPIASVVEIEGNLNISHTGLEIIELPNLVKAGRIAVQSLDVTHLRFPLLKTVADELTVGMNHPDGQGFPPAHEFFEEMYVPKLEYVGGNFILNICSSLKTLEHLANLSFVGGEFVIIGGEFESLKGLENLKKVEKSFEVSGCYKLKSLDGFMLKEAGFGLELGLEYVTSLAPLASIEKIGKVLTLRRNRKLTNFEGLEHIDVPVIQLSMFEKITSLKGLPIKETMEYLNLSGFHALTDITALSKLKYVETFFNLEECPLLTNLDGLDNLRSVGGSFFLVNFNKMADMSAINNIETIVGELRIIALEVLENLPQFTKLTEIGSLLLDKIKKIKSLDGLESITKIVKGGLVVFNCSELTDVKGLENITEVNVFTQQDKIHFEGNALLKSYDPIGVSLLQKYLPANKIHIKKNGYNPTKANIIAGEFTGEGGDGVSGGR